MAEVPDSPDEVGDDAVAALRALVDQLERTTVELGAAVDRAHQLVALRADGTSWHEIVRTEERPLIIERISRALDDLGAAGNRFRREEALALTRENVSITEIGKLFGVSRQRASVLVQDPATTAGRPPR